MNSLICKNNRRLRRTNKFANCSVAHFSARSATLFSGLLQITFECKLCRSRKKAVPSFGTHNRKSDTLSSRFRVFFFFFARAASELIETSVLSEDLDFFFFSFSFANEILQRISIRWVTLRSRTHSAGGRVGQAHFSHREAKATCALRLLLYFLRGSVKYPTPNERESRCGGQLTSG